MKYKNGDIVRWRWTDEKLKTMDLEKQSGTMYWCQSQIAIFKNGQFKDTYWHSSGEGFKFSEDRIDNDIEVEFVENIENLEPCSRSDCNYYAESDCVNISHKNMSRDGFYIKKGSVKSLEKMKHVINAHINHHEKEIEHSKRNLIRLRKDLENLTVDSWLPCNDDVYIP